MRSLFNRILQGGDTVTQPTGIYLAWADDNSGAKVFLDRVKCKEYLEKHGGGSYIIAYNAAGAIVHKVPRK